MIKSDHVRIQEIFPGEGGGEGYMFAGGGVPRHICGNFIMLI